jgi:hypothetical protein
MLHNVCTPHWKEKNKKNKKKWIAFGTSDETLRKTTGGKRREEKESQQRICFVPFFFCWVSASQKVVVPLMHILLQFEETWMNGLLVPMEIYRV